MITKKFCPNCGSNDVELIAGGITGSWMCRNCGYSGSVFPEKPILGREEQSKEKGKDKLSKLVRKK